MCKYVIVEYRNISFPIGSINYFYNPLVVSFCCSLRQYWNVTSFKTDFRISDFKMNIQQVQTECRNVPKTSVTYFLTEVNVNELNSFLMWHERSQGGGQRCCSRRSDR